MKNSILFCMCLFLFSCMGKPEVSEEQNAQYEACKKTLLENKDLFIASGKTQARQDSLKDYLADIEKYKFDELLQKYEVPQEQVIVFLYSICQNAERVNRAPSVLETMESAENMLKVLDSMIIADSLKNLKSR